jgi:hypothetical protein
MVFGDRHHGGGVFIWTADGARVKAGVVVPLVPGAMVVREVWTICPG